MSKPHVLIIVQNLSVPYDRRVWLECNTLIDNGFDVSVICPRAKNDKKREVLNGVQIYRYAPAPMTQSKASFFVEFFYCWIRTFILSFVVLAKKKIDVIQTCNPPDTYWLLGLIHRPFGSVFVFDQHDLCPEIFDARFTAEKSALLKFLRKGLVFLERMNYAVAVRIISTNESYKNLAMKRGRKKETDITIVRSGPNAEKLYPVQPNEQLKRGHKHLIVYIGVMGPQDRVDIAIDAMDEIVNNLGRNDIALALLGDGDCFEELKKQSAELNLSEHVEFVGRANDETIRDYFSTASLGVAPDPATEFNSHSTHNKIMEYMIFSLPVVAFNLKETKVSGQEAVVVVEKNADPKTMAYSIVSLLDDEKRRKDLGKFARDRVLNELTWDHQSGNYLSVIKEAFATSRKGKRSAH